MIRNGMLRQGTCPFVDSGDGRCSCRMTKQTLDQAFNYCLGGQHFACHTYQAISWERRADRDESETQLQPGTPSRHPNAPRTGPRYRPAATQRTTRLTFAGKAVA